MSTGVKHILAFGLSSVAFDYFAAIILFTYSGLCAGQAARALAPTQPGSEHVATRELVASINRPLVTGGVLLLALVQLVALAFMVAIKRHHRAELAERG
jgi:hypothetical protein